MLSIFSKGYKPPIRKIYAPPIIPRDFVPLHKVNAVVKENCDSSQSHTTNKSTKLTVKERGQALGEVPLNTSGKSVFDYIADDDKKRLNQFNEKEKGKEQNEMSKYTASKIIKFKSSGFKPFAKDPQKQARYEHFLSGKTASDPEEVTKRFVYFNMICSIDKSRYTPNISFTY